MKFSFLLLIASGTVMLASCTDDESLCREPGYTCASHVSDKDSVCSIPGYTCTPSDDDGVSPITGKRRSDSGSGDM